METGHKMDFDSLIIEYLTGGLRGENAREFLRIVETDEECARRFDELNRLYASSLTPYYESRREKNWEKLRRRIKETPFMVFKKRHSIAAAIAAIAVISGICAGVLGSRSGETEELLCEISVPEGSRTRLMLPDSSTVWLNSGARLAYAKDFGKKGRDVYLEGEGYFEVRRDERHPFTVSTEDLAVKVLGTVFNVRENGNTTVDLISGKVEVSTAEGLAMTLSPGERAVLDHSTGNLSKKLSEPFVSDWTAGRMSFTNTSMSEILTRLQKHFNVRIELQDNSLAQERFSGSIDLDMTLDEILRYLDVDGKYSVTMYGGVIRISKR